MPTRIDVPNFGSIDFPDEMSLDDITSALRKQFPPQSEAESKWVIQDTLSRLGKGVAEQGAQAIQGVARGLSIASAQTIPANLRAIQMQAEMAGEDTSSINPVIAQAAKAAPVRAMQATQENPFYQFGRDIEETAGQFYQPNPAYNDTVQSKLIQGVASTVPVLASGPLAPITYAGMMGETSAREAEEKGASPEKVADTFLANAALGMTSEFLLGVPYLLRSAKAVKGVTADVSKTALGKRLAALTVKHPVASLAVRGGVAEAIQEGPIEQTGQNAIAKFVGQYDTDRPIFQDVAEQAAYGAAIGLLLGGLFGGAAKIDRARQEEREAFAQPEGDFTFQDPVTKQWLNAADYAARQSLNPQQAQLIANRRPMPIMPFMEVAPEFVGEFDVEKRVAQLNEEEENAIALRQQEERERARNVAIRGLTTVEAITEAKRLVGENELRRRANAILNDPSVERSEAQKKAVPSEAMSMELAARETVSGYWIERPEPKAVDPLSAQPAIISRGRFRPAPTQQTVRPAFVQPPPPDPITAQLYQEADEAKKKAQAEWPTTYDKIVKASGLDPKLIEEGLALPGRTEATHPTDYSSLPQRLSSNVPGGYFTKLYNLLADEQHQGAFSWGGTADSPQIGFSPQVAGGKPDPVVAQKTLDAFNGIRAELGMEPIPTFFKPPTVAKPATVEPPAMAGKAEIEFTLKWEKGVPRGDLVDGLEMIGEGSESTVYRKGNKVVKVSEPYNSNTEDDYQKRIARAILVDSLLGDGSLEVAGFYRSPNGTKNPIFIQNHVEGRPATREEIKRHMVALGFSVKESGSTTDTFSKSDGSNEVVVADLDGDNVRMTSEGVRVIDANVTESHPAPVPVPPVAKQSFTTETPAQSFQKAEAEVDARRAKYREATSKLPDGTVIAGWKKTTVAGDVFWIKGKRQTVDVLVEAGQKAVDEHLTTETTVKVRGEAKAKPVTPQQQIRLDAKEFDDSLHAFGFTGDPSTQTKKWHGGKVLQNEQLQSARRKAFSELRAEGDPMKEADRAALLSKLKEYNEKVFNFEQNAESRPVNMMSIGDKFTILDEPFKVLEVTADGEVMIQGRSMKRLNDADSIQIDPGSYVQIKQSGEFVPPENLQLNQPESIDDQKARLARKEAERKAKEAREKVIEGASKPLIGKTGDIGQGDLLGGGDLFSPPSPPAFGSKNKLVSNERAEQLRQRIKDKLKQGPKNVSMLGTGGLDPSIFSDAVQLGAHYIEGGWHKFVDWIAKMREHFTAEELSDKHLSSIYETARITIESPIGQSRSGQPPGLQPGLRPPTERIVTARPELTKPADESIIPQELVKHLDPHQKQGAAKAIRKMEEHGRDGGGFLLASGTGAGKTRSAITVAHYYAKRGFKVIIVTKSETIKQDWKKKTFGGSYDFDSRAMGVPIRLAKDASVKPGEIGITTYENANDVERHTDANTVLIFDEVHALKNDSQRAKYGIRAISKANSVMFMSATPADKPEHIYYLARAGIMEGKTTQQQLRDLGMTLVTIQKMVNENGKWQKRNVTFWAEDQQVSEQERNRRFSALFDRMTENGAMLKHEISMDGVHVQVLRLSLPPEAHGTMDRILRFFDAQHIDDLKGLKKAIVLGHQRRQQEPFKIASTVMLTQRELEAGRQVVIFVSRVNASEVGKWVKVGMPGGEQERVREVLMQSEGTAKTMREALEDAGIHDIAEIHGNADQESLEAMADFQAGRKRVVIATIESGGTGINLDDILGNRPRSMIVVTAPFDAVGNVQAAGRIWRLKTLSGANLFYLFGDTDVDRWNADIIGTKMSTLGAVVEGQVRRLDISNPDSVTTDEYHEQVETPATQEQKPATDFPLLDWKPFKTYAGKDRFNAPATPEFWQWWNANGKRDNTAGISVQKWQGEWQVWSDRPIAQHAAPQQGASTVQPSDIANKIADSLQNIKSGTRPGDLHLFGVAIDLWDRAVSIAQAIIRGGGRVADAVAAAISHIRANYTGQWDEAGATASLNATASQAPRPTVESTTTRVLGLDEAALRRVIKPEDLAQGRRDAERLYDEAGIPWRRTSANLLVPQNLGAVTEANLRSLIAIAKRELDPLLQAELAQPDAPFNDRRANFNNSIRVWAEQMRSDIYGGRHTRLPMALFDELFAVTQGEVSEAGKKLYLHKEPQIDEMERIASAPEGELLKIWKEQYDAGPVQSTLQAIRLYFQNFFDVDQIDTVLAGHPSARAFLDELLGDSVVSPKPTVQQMIKAIFATPIYRHAELGQRLVRILTEQLGIPLARANEAARIFNTAFAESIDTAWKKALAQAQDRLTPKEKSIAGPGTKLWKKLQDFVNSKGADDYEFFRSWVRDMSGSPPTDSDISQLRAASERAQQLLELTPRQLQEVAANPSQEESIKRKRADATVDERAELHKRMVTLWKRFTRPLGWKHWFAGADVAFNNAQAANEWAAGNILTRLTFATKQVIDIGTTNLFYTPQRALAHAFQRYINARNLIEDEAGARADLWKDITESLSEAYAVRNKTIGARFNALGQGIAGRGLPQNVEGIKGGTHTYDRIQLRVNELLAEGTPEARAKAFVYLIGGLGQMGFRVAGALDVFQGVPIEFQEIRQQVVTELRSHGKPRAVAMQQADEVIGDIQSARTLALAEARAILEESAEPGKTFTDGQVSKAAWEMVKGQMYIRMKALSLNADEFEARNNLTRQLYGWNLPEEGGLGGAFAKFTKGTQDWFARAGIPTGGIAAFGNAIGTLINRKLTWAGLGFMPQMFKGSPWYGNELEVLHRKAEAGTGLATGAAAFLLSATGVIVIHSLWPDDPKERERWEREGIRPGTAEIPLGDGTSIHVSTTTGPLSYIGPYLAAGGALFDLARKRADRQTKADAEADRKGLARGDIDPISASEVVGVLSAAAQNAMFGGRTASGIKGAYSDYGKLNLKRSASSFAASFVPGLPAYNELTRLAGISIDPKRASFWDLFVPMPNSTARRVNMLGDDVGNPDSMQRVMGMMTGGTSIRVGADVKDQGLAYANLFASSYRPPPLSAAKGYNFGGAFRPMNPREYGRYVEERGKAFKQELEQLGSLDGLGSVEARKAAQGAFQRANQRALASVGVSEIKPKRAYTRRLRTSGGITRRGRQPKVGRIRRGRTPSFGKLRPARAPRIKRTVLSGSRKPRVQRIVPANF